MQPNANNNMMGNASQAAPRTVSQVAPASQNVNMMAQDMKPRKNKGIIIGMAVLAVLAAGGIGFGVWAFLSGNQKEAKLNDQISSLQTQLAEQPKIMDDTTIIEDGYSNPIIKSVDSEKTYTVYFSSSNVYANQRNNLVDISVSDGTVSRCEIGLVEYTDTGGRKESDFQTCNINGLSGEIYKVVEFGAGQDNLYDYIGFIMTDGTVQYIPLYEAVEKNDFSIRGKLNLEKYIVDAFNVMVSGGYGATVFVFNDGTYVEYNESMLN